MRYRVTYAGMLYFLALTFVGLGAFLAANNLLFLIFATMMALLLVSGFLSRLTISGLELELQLPEHVSAGAPTPARIVVRNLKRLTPSFSIELTGPGDKPVYLPLLPGGAALEAPLEIVFPRRGRHHENLFFLSTQFPFGFIRRTTPVALHRETIVYPNLDASHPAIDALLDSLTSQLAALTRGAGREFHSIRPYETLDDVRHIDWKSTAHTGALQVREFARDRHTALEICLDRRIAPGEEQAFETLIEQCASLAWNLTLRNTDLWFHSQNFAAEGNEIYDILAFLALVEPLTGKTDNMIEFPQNASELRVVFTTQTGLHLEATHIVGPAAAEPAFDSRRVGQ